MEQIAESLQPFTFGKVQDAVTMMLKAKRVGLTLEDLVEYTDWVVGIRQAEIDVDRSRANLKLTAWLKHGPKCPHCGQPLSVRALPPKGKANVKGYASQFFCQSGNCTYEEFSMTPREVIVGNVYRAAENARGR